MFKWGNIQNTDPILNEKHSNLITWSTFLCHHDHAQELRTLKVARFMAHPVGNCPSNLFFLQIPQVTQKLLQTNWP